MKKIVVILISLFVFVPFVKADELNVYLFYSDICSTCEAEIEFLEDYVKENDLNLVMYETTKSGENANLLVEVREALNNNENTVPYTVIGTTGMTGFNDTVEN